MLLFILFVENGKYKSCVRGGFPEKMEKVENCEHTNLFGIFSNRKSCSYDCDTGNYSYTNVWFNLMNTSTILKTKTVTKNKIKNKKF